MSWKQIRGPLLAGAAAVGIVFSGYRTTAQPSTWPEIGTIAAIAVGLLVATTIITPGLHPYKSI